MASVAEPSALEYTSSFPRHASVHDAITQIVEKVAEDDILVEDEELLIKTLIKILVELGETAAADAVRHIFGRWAVLLSMLRSVPAFPSARPMQCSLPIDRVAFVAHSFHCPPLPRQGSQAPCFRYHLSSFAFTMLALSTSRFSFTLHYVLKDDS